MSTRMFILPDRLFTLPILSRGLLLWGCTRSALALGSWLMGGGDEPLMIDVTGKAAAWLIALTGALGVLEIRRRNEHLLLANLGSSQPVLAALAMAPALVAAVTLALLVDGAARS